MAATDLVGKPLPPATVVVERGPVQKFVDALKDTNPVYRSLDAAKATGLSGIPMPPTFPFVLTYWGTFAEGQPEPAEGAESVATVLGDLARQGGLILHGEQEFTYHSPVVVGQTLSATGSITDVYTKEGGGGATMTFIKATTEFRHPSGELAATSTMTILHRSKPPTG